MSIDTPFHPDYKHIGNEPENYYEHMLERLKEQFKRIYSFNEGGIVPQNSTIINTQYEMAHRIETEGIKLVQTDKGKLELQYKGEKLPFIQDIYISQDIDEHQHNIASVCVDLLVTTTVDKRHKGECPQCGKDLIDVTDMDSKNNEYLCSNDECRVVNITYNKNK